MHANAHIKKQTKVPFTSSECGNLSMTIRTVNDGSCFQKIKAHAVKYTTNFSSLNKKLDLTGSLRVFTKYYNLKAYSRQYNSRIMLFQCIVWPSIL